jgi:hypothetical protein
MPRAACIGAATLLAVVACGGTLSGQQASSVPAVAVVLTDGKLLPLAARSAAGWQLLPWPHHEFHDGQPEPPSLMAIPKDWFAPLTTLPTTWRFQPINGKRTVIHSAAPTRWQIASFDATGFATDYVDPDSNRRSFDYNAGIAVAGDVEALPVRELDESSPEWNRLVARHAKAFLNAERADARRHQVHLKGHTTTTTASELRTSEVVLSRVELDAKHAYEYFEAIVQRPADADAKRLNCPTQSVEYHGLIEERGRSEVVKWISGAELSCGELTEVMDVVGGLRGADGVRLVVEYSGDDWQTFAIVNPAGPESQIRRGPRASGVRGPAIALELPVVARRTSRESTR